MLPTVRKADGGKCDGGPVGTTYNGPMSLTRTDVKRGPNSHRPPPCRNPHPSPHSFDRLGPPFCGPVQSLCDGLGAEAFQISAPSISAPSIKDDATHGEESGRREMRWRPRRYDVFFRSFLGAQRPEEQCSELHSASLCSKAQRNAPSAFGIASPVREDGLQPSRAASLSRC
jgi:hypothetical protein